MFGSCTASGGAVGECEIGDSFNAGEAKIYGFELLAQTVIESRGLTFPLSVSYTSTSAKFLNTFSSNFWGSVVSGDNIPDMPDRQLALSAGFDTGSRLSGTGTLYAVGDTCSVASCSSGTKINSHWELDISLRFAIRENIDTYLTMMNVTDQANIVARAPKNGARAQMPRATLVGLRWRF